MSVSMSASTVASTLPLVASRRMRIVAGPEPDVFADLGARWTRIDRVPFGSAVEIDHVLLSTAGVFVATAVDATTELPRAVAEARWRARKIGFLVDRAGRPHVTPVLVVPGAGRPETVDGVVICHRADVSRFCAEIDALPPTLDPACLNHMVDILVDHTLRTDEINGSYAAG